MIEVIQPGIMTTVQDLGRPGHYRRGIPPSGALDLVSHRLANALVRNHEDAATLEFTFTGPTLRFSSSVDFAVTGGGVPIMLNGEEIEPWQSHRADADDVLSFGFLQSGVRGYIGFSGGLAVPHYLGSASTLVNAGLGGIDGRKLVAGDVLRVDRPTAPSVRAVLDSRFQPPFFSRDVELRYIPGLFDYRLTPDGRRDFSERVWTVTPSADRTGVRLSTANRTPLEFVSRSTPFGTGDNPSNVVDTGYPLGAIQLPAGIEPIVLSRDAVTAGGYCTAGAVISADLDRLGQAVTHSQVQFVPVSIEDAAIARNERREFIARAIDSLS